MGEIIIKKDVIERWAKNKTSAPRTQAEIATHIGVSPSLLSKVISGVRQATPNLQRKLCDLTGYDVGDLFTYKRN